VPPAPPEGAFSFLGISVTNASVVSMRAEIEAAFCSAVRSHLGRIEDAGLHQVLVFAGSHVETFIAAALHDFLDDQSAFLASVVGELARRKLECAANDFRANSLITFQLNAIERFLCTKVSNASAGKQCQQRSRRNVPFEGTNLA
jgi:hypothetical protein